MSRIDGCCLSAHPISPTHRHWPRQALTSPGLSLASQGPPRIISGCWKKHWHPKAAVPLLPGPAEFMKNRFRRLQLASKDGYSWGILFRPEESSKNASPAELRLRLRPVPGNSPGYSPGKDNSAIAVKILKRRGAGKARNLRSHSMTSCFVLCRISARWLLTRTFRQPRKNSHLTALQSPPSRHFVNISRHE